MSSYSETPIRCSVRQSLLYRMWHAFKQAWAPIKQKSPLDWLADHRLNSASTTPWWIFFPYCCLHPVTRAIYASRAGSIGQRTCTGCEWAIWVFPRSGTQSTLYWQFHFSRRRQQEQQQQQQQRHVCRGESHSPSTQCGRCAKMQWVTAQGPLWKHTLFWLLHRCASLWIVAPASQEGRRLGGNKQHFVFVLLWMVQKNYIAITSIIWTHTWSFFFFFTHH